MRHVRDGRDTEHHHAGVAQGLSEQDTGFGADRGSEDPLTSVVDVYIRRLRSKIDDGHAIPLIQTVRGPRYRLAAPGPSAYQVVMSNHQANSGTSITSKPS